MEGSRPWVLGMSLCRILQGKGPPLPCLSSTGSMMASACPPEHPWCGLDCVTEESNMKAWKRSATIPTSDCIWDSGLRAVLVSVYMPENEFQHWCLVHVESVSFSFYTGQSRLGGWGPAFSAHREKEDFVSEQNRPLGATALKDGSCELWYVVSAFYLISAMAGVM